MNKVEKYETIFSQIYDELREGEEALQPLDNLRNWCSDNEKANGKSDVLSTILGKDFLTMTQDLGSRGIMEEAMLGFGIYSEFVKAYTNAKAAVKKVICDFVEIRGRVAYIFRKYATKLVDVFGDYIKKVAPKLFDFEAIQYLNVEEMYGAVKLEYDKLLDILLCKCEKLISDNNEWAYISDNDEWVLKSEAEARRDRDQLKQDISYLVNIEYSKLESVFATMRDYYVVKARSFFKYCNEVMSKELLELFGSSYQDDAIRDLAQKRDAIWDECIALERKIADSTMNIEYYKGKISATEEMLEYKSPDYELAKSEMPQKPFFLTNWLTFGSAQKKYHRHYFDWKTNYKSFIDEYDKCMSGISTDRNELAVNRSNLKAANSELLSKPKELQAINEQIAEKIKVSDEVKSRMSDHLGSLLNLLRIAKEIAEIKLDGSQTEIVRAGETELPKDLEDSINDFVHKQKAH